MVPDKSRCAHLVLVAVLCFSGFSTSLVRGEEETPYKALGIPVFNTTEIPDAFEPFYIETVTASEAGRRSKVGHKSKVYSKLAMRDVPQNISLCDSIPTKFCPTFNPGGVCNNLSLAVVCWYSNWTADPNNLIGSQTSVTYSWAEVSTYSLISGECSHQIMHAFDMATGSNTALLGNGPSSYPDFIKGGHCFWDWCIDIYTSINPLVGPACNNANDNALKTMCTTTSGFSVWSPMVYGCMDTESPPEIIER